MKRAATKEEIKPLIELCKAGRLFDVQRWIASGKPIDPPLPQPKVQRQRSPLQYAIESGFHSLVQVLLEAIFGCFLGEETTAPRFGGGRESLGRVPMRILAECS